MEEKDLSQVALDTAIVAAMIKRLTMLGMPDLSEIIHLMTSAILVSSSPC